jgi:hypothetical protein
VAGVAMAFFAAFVILGTSNPLLVAFTSSMALLSAGLPSLLMAKDCPMVLAWHNTINAATAAIYFFLIKQVEYGTIYKSFLQIPGQGWIKNLKIKNNPAANSLQPLQLFKKITRPAQYPVLPICFFINLALLTTLTITTCGGNLFTNTPANKTAMVPWYSFGLLMAFRCGRLHTNP